MCCSNFWIEMATSHPDDAKMPLKLLIPFSTTYKGEKAFSAVVTIKTKSLNRLDATCDMRIALSNTQLNIDKFLKAKQAHSCR